MSANKHILCTFCQKKEDFVLSKTIFSESTLYVTRSVKLSFPNNSSISHPQQLKVLYSRHVQLNL